MDRIIQLLINAAALYVAVVIVPNLEFTGEWWKLLVVAFIFGLVNTFLRPILRILTLPITLMTLGIFLIILNALAAAPGERHLG
jgi:putative membrane protein